MESISGVIEGVARKPGESQPWVYTINGKRYSTFNKEIAGKFAAGMNVEITGEMNDKGYWTMKTMTLADPVITTEKIGPKPASNTQTMYVSYAKDLFIAMYSKDVAAKDIMTLAIQLVKHAKEAFE